MIHDGMFWKLPAILLLVFALGLFGGCGGGDDDDVADDDVADDDVADDDAADDDVADDDAADDDVADDDTGDDDTGGGEVGECNMGCDAILSGYTACGGDIVGTWTIDDFCGVRREYEILSGCPEEGMHRAFWAGAGTVTFGATNMDYYSYQIGYAYLVDVPTSCIPAPYACESIAPMLMPIIGATAGDCLVVGSDCECEFCTDMTPPGDNNHTYSVSGDDITQDGEPAGTYCVDGDTLTMHLYEGTEFEHVAIFQRS